MKYVDGNKLNTFIREKGFTQKKFCKHIGINLNLLRNLLNNLDDREKSTTVLPHLKKCAKGLDVEVADLLLPTSNFPLEELNDVSILMFKNDYEFDDYLYKYEIKYGRHCIFNTFPSTIYFNENKSSKRRFLYLSELDNDFQRNFELYPIDRVLDFCFNEINNRFDNRKRIEILLKVIKSFTKSDGKPSSSRFIHIFDPQIANYYHDSSTCTFIKSKGILFMPSPTEYNHLIKIVNFKMAEEIHNYVNSKPVLSVYESINIINIIIYSLQKNKDMHYFLNKLKDENTKFYNMVIKYIH